MLLKILMNKYKEVTVPTAQKLKYNVVMIVQ